MKVFLKKFFLIYFLLFVSSYYSYSAETQLEPEYKFSIISSLVANILATDNYVHLNKATISSDLFDSYMKSLDPNHMYFTQEDIAQLQKKAGNLYSKILKGDTQFAFDAYNKLLEKVKMREEYSKKLIAAGFNFKKNEEYIFDRSKENWAANETVLDEIWRQKLKNDILSFRMMDKIVKSEKDLTSQKSKKKKQSSTLTPEERTLQRLKNYRISLDDSSPIDVLELYLTSLSELYDPHSSYMSPKSEDNFNTQMQLSFVGIGALLSSDNGYVVVENVLPGGSAEKSGLLKTGDRIIAVGDEGKPSVDVIDMPVDKVVDKIRGKQGTYVNLTILPENEGAMAVPKIITLKRDIVELKSSEASYELKNIKDPFGKVYKVGVITLPSFYLDFQGIENGDKDYKSSTKDVKKILENLEKDKVDGVIMDLRNNGGGSLKEAIDLTGLFIGKGPVVQTKNSKGNISIEEDPDEKAYYTGPLIVMENKLSASAAEIFAGAIQDYKRGIIVGDEQTHGKGTVQTVVDLGAILSNFGIKIKAGAIKITNAKFYRVSGESTQNKGVEADIPFESLLDHMDIGEGTLDHAMPWDTIASAEYTHCNDMVAEALPTLEKESKERQNSSADFKKLDSIIELYTKTKDKKSVSLNEKERWKSYLDEKKIIDEQKNLSDSILPIKTNADTDKSDVYLNETLRIMADYIDYIKEHKNLPRK